MRKYPIDSPQAMARIISVALLADGGLDPSELEVLDRRTVIERLGMDHHDFDVVIHELCEDLLQSVSRDEYGEFHLDRRTIDAMLGEIRSPHLQKRLLRMIVEIVHADRWLSSGEAVLTTQAMQRWEIDLHEIAPAPRRRARRWPPHVRRGAAGTAP